MVKNVFNIATLVINLFFLAGLLISGLSIYISPEKTTIPAILGLFFIFFILSNILFVIYWIIKLKWYFILSLAGLLLLSNNISNIFPINKKEKAASTSSAEDSLKIVSYNVKLFDFYTKNKSESKNNILSYILEKDADIVCLQEYGYSHNNQFLTEKDILTLLGKTYKYNHIETNDKQSYGVATFSKYKIINKQEIVTTSKNNLSIYSDIKIKDKTVRVFNCHLESNQLTHKDKKKISELVDDLDRDELQRTTGLLSRKLRQAFKRRALQVDTISKEIAQSSFPTLVCGDFNDTPISYTYRKMRGSLSDAFVQTSTGLGITYNEGVFRFRIDYILHSKELKPFSFTIDKVKYSDHYPISCSFSFNK
jgi:endonuclease/exonuclease/phosphatase family metal-dependent hydrolase